jgi:hypothetical protein
MTAGPITGSVRYLHLLRDGAGPQPAVPASGLCCPPLVCAAFPRFGACLRFTVPTSGFGVPARGLRPLPELARPGCPPASCAPSASHPRRGSPRRPQGDSNNATSMSPQQQRCQHGCRYVRAAMATRPPRQAQLRSTATGAVTAGARGVRTDQNLRIGSARPAPTHRCCDVRVSRVI